MCGDLLAFFHFIFSIFVLVLMDEASYFVSEIFKGLTTETNHIVFISLRIARILTFEKGCPK